MVLLSSNGRNQIGQLVKKQNSEFLSILYLDGHCLIAFPFWPVLSLSLDWNLFFSTAFELFDYEMMMELWQSNLIYSNNVPFLVYRPPAAPIPGPKPNKPARPQGDFSSIQSSSSSSSYSPQYSMASAPSAHHPGNNAVANGYHYTQPGTAAGHAPLQPQYGNSNNSINHHNNMQYHHQENRRATTLPPPLLPPPPPASNSSASSSSSAFNGFHYPFAPQANAPAPISPHHVGLPLTGFSINNHSIPS
jgi:hypothetical protein